MRVLSIVTAASILLTGSVALLGASEILDVQTARYAAGSVWWGFPAPIGATAAGPVDCTGATGDALGANLGGACFDVSALPPMTELRVSVADDLALAPTSFFAAFDRDGDGCAGCTPADAATDGTGAASLLRELPTDATLFVFVRALGAPETAIGTSGTITITAFAPGTGPCSRDGRGDGPLGPECGDKFRGDGVPYPYAGVGGDGSLP